MHVLYCTLGGRLIHAIDRRLVRHVPPARTSPQLGSQVAFFAQPVLTAPDGTLVLRA